MGIEEYNKVVKGWEAKYGVPSRLRRYNPAETTASCKRCGFIRAKMSRHHIRNDFFFANLLPDKYARRYIEFHSNDVVKLCDTCHRDVHRYYKPIIARMYVEFNVKKNMNQAITYEWCEGWRTEFYNLFQRWLKLKSRTRNQRRKKRGV